MGAERLNRHDFQACLVPRPVDDAAVSLGCRESNQPQEQPGPPIRQYRASEPPWGSSIRRRASRRHREVPGELLLGDPVQEHQAKSSSMLSSRRPASRSGEGDGPAGGFLRAGEGILPVYKGGHVQQGVLIIEEVEDGDVFGAGRAEFLLVAVDVGFHFGHGALLVCRSILT